MPTRSKSSTRADEPRSRRKGLILLAKIAAGVFVALLVVALVPPLRNAAALGTSKAILFIASPLAPDIDDFEDLPETTKVLAADGAVLAALRRVKPVSGAGGASGADGQAASVPSPLVRDRRQLTP